MILGEGERQMILGDSMTHIPSRSQSTYTGSRAFPRFGSFLLGMTLPGGSSLSDSKRGRKRRDSSSRDYPFVLHDIPHSIARSQETLTVSRTSGLAQLFVNTKGMDGEFEVGVEFCVLNRT